MPFDRLADALDAHVSILHEQGIAKGKETVVTGVCRARGDRGPRFLLEGEGEKEFIRMNSNSYLGLGLHPEVIEAEEGKDALSGETYHLMPLMERNAYLTSLIDDERMHEIPETLLGPDFPIVLTLDLHTNVSSRMVENSTATIFYRTCPHVRQRDRGLEAAELIARTVRGEVHPVQALRKPPLLPHILKQVTESGPMAEIMAEVDRISRLPGILSASFAPGYIYADVAEMGPTALVVADKDAEKAETEVQKLADFVWERREALTAKLTNPESAVREAAARAQKNAEGAERLRNRFFARMWDLSAFMKVLKQRFTHKLVNGMNNSIALIAIFIKVFRGVIANLHWISPATYFNNRCVIKMLREPLWVDGC